MPEWLQMSLILAGILVGVSVLWYLPRFPRLFGSISAFSLLLLVVAVGIWIVSFFIHPVVGNVYIGHFVVVFREGGMDSAIPFLLECAALAFTILPAVWLYKWNKRRKLGPNACPSCGYDLTGNESGVCPECGGSRMAG